DRDDPVVAIDDDDLVADHEVHVTAPIRVDLDQRRRDLHHAHAGRHLGADADREIDVACARHIAADQHGLPDLGALVAGQRHAAAAALLGLSLWGLSCLAGLTLRRLPLLHRALLALRRALALLALALTGGRLVLLTALLRLALLVLILAL